MAIWLIYEMCTNYMFHEFGIKRAPTNGPPTNYLPNLSDVILTSDKVGQTKVGNVCKANCRP